MIRRWSAMAWPYLMGVFLAALVIWLKTPTASLTDQVPISSSSRNEVVSEPVVNFQEDELRRLFNEALHEEEVKAEVSRRAEKPVEPVESAVVKEQAKKDNKAPACRQRWTKYLGQNKKSLPSKFDEACKRYNRLHDKHLREQDLEASLDTNLFSAKNTIRYLVWRRQGDDEGGQLGSLLSAYLLALLTDRVLLVDEPRMNDVLCEPFTRSSWILPEHLGPILREQAISMNEAVATRAPVRVARLELVSPDPDTLDDKHKLNCHGSVKGALNHIQWLLVDAGWPWAELLLTNPTHAARLTEMFEGQPAYQLLLRFLIHPSNGQWEKATAMYHTFYSDEPDKPYRLAMFLDPAQAKDPSLVKQCVEGALADVFKDPLSRACLYYHPSQTGREPETLWRSVWPNYDRYIISGSGMLYTPHSLSKWKQLVIDLWMASWANQVVFTTAIDAQNGGMSRYAAFMARQMRDDPITQAFLSESECTLAVFDQWTLLDIPSLCNPHRRK